MLIEVNGKCTNESSCSAFNLLRYESVCFVTRGERSVILISLRGGVCILLKNDFHGYEICY